MSIKRPTWPSWIVKPSISNFEKISYPDDKTLRIVISTKNSNGLESLVDILDLARSRYFAIIDTVDKNITNVKIIENKACGMRKAALIVSYWLVQIGTNIVISSGYCHNTAYYLDQAGIMRLITEPEIKVIECLKKFNLVNI